MLAGLDSAVAAGPASAAQLAAGPVSGPDTGAETGARLRRGRLREYWLQAESFFHNLVANGRDEMMGTTFTPAQSSYWALGYRAYTPGWGTPLPASDEIGRNDGIPGPVIRGEVGDTIRVHFRNADTHYRFPHSVHPHGVRYDPASDGAWLAVTPDRPGTAVAVGQTYTYEWKAVASSVGTWPYHDHSAPQSLTGGDPVAEIGAELGLFGLIAITDAQTPRVDRELDLFFHDLYQDDVPSLSQDFDAFNGGSFLENTPTFSARVGERLRWRIGAMGKEFHVFHLHGHRWRFGDRYDDSVLLGPSATLTVDYTEGQSRSLALPLPCDRPHDGRHGRLLRRDRLRRPSGPAKPISLD